MRQTFPIIYPLSGGLGNQKNIRSDGFNMGEIKMSNKTKRVIAILLCIALLGGLVFSTLWSILYML